MHSQLQKMRADAVAQHHAADFYFPPIEFNRIGLVAPQFPNTRCLLGLQHAAVFAQQRGHQKPTHKRRTEQPQTFAFQDVHGFGLRWSCAQTGAHSLRTLVHGIEIVGAMPKLQGAQTGQRFAHGRAARDVGTKLVGPYEIVEYSAKVLVAPSRMPDQLPAMGLQCFGRNGIPHLLGPSPQVAPMAAPTVHQIIQCHTAWVALSAVPAHAVHQPCDHFARWRVRTHQGPGLLRKIVFAPKPRDILFAPFRIRRIPPRVHRTRRPRRQQQGKLGGTRKGSMHRHILADTACT